MHPDKPNKMTTDYNGYSWIKVKKYKMDESLSWEERYRQLEQHHIEETTFLIEEVRKVAGRENMHPDKMRRLKEVGWRAGTVEEFLGATMVFWVCPNHCGGQIKWNEDVSDAECLECGCKKSDTQEE